MKKFIILGNSNGAVSMIFETLFQIHQTEFEVEIVENIKTKDQLPYSRNGIHIVKIFHDQWVYHKDAELKNPFIMGLNRPQNKTVVYDFFKKNYKINFQNYTNLIHPKATIASSVKLHNGIKIEPGAVIAPFAEIGNIVYINRNASIGHHTVVKDFCSIFPGANIAGLCKIGEGVQIGMGANILEEVTIGDNTVIGAGALVTQSLPANVTAYGVPAKIIKSV